MEKRKFDVVVVGLGAVGASALYHLSKSGKKVLGIDRFDPPHGMGSSHGETRITRIAVGEGEDYVALARRSHELWREIESESDEAIMTNTGGILLDSGIKSWGKHGSEGFWDQTVRFAVRQNVSHQIWTPDQLKTRHKAFELGPSGKVYFETEAGYLRPEVAINAQLDLARKNGAETRVNSPVLELRQEESGIGIGTENEWFSASKVLLSAGGWIKDFLPEDELPKFKICRQVLHWLEIESGKTDWASYPVWMWGFGPHPEDFIYGFPSLDGISVKVATESFVEIPHPEFLNREVSVEEQVQFWKTKIEGRISGLRPKFLKSSVCFYTVTEDARFVVKEVEGFRDLTLVSACSGHGFKHSTALGEQLAHSLLGKVVS
jgi:sarcosine oxidase